MSPVISQGEIDALWDSMFEEGSGEDETGGSARWNEVRQYDFREAYQLSQHELEGLRQVGQRVSRHVEQNLRAYLRSPAECSLTGVEEGRYGDFLRVIPDRTVVGEMQCPPLSLNILWEVNFNVAFAIVERMMGWRGATSPPDRAPSTPELSLLSSVMRRLGEWLAQAMAETVEIQPQLLRVLVPPAHEGVMPESQPVVMAVMELSSGDVSGSTTLCIPTEALLPIRERLRAGRGAEPSAKQQDANLRVRLASALGQVMVLVRAELGSGQVMLGELTSLTEGDVLALNREVGAYADVVVGSRARFRGVPGYRGKRLAVEIREVLGPEEPQTQERPAR